MCIPWHDDREVIQTIGDYRAVIIPDEHANRPDACGTGAVIRLDGRYPWRFTVEYADCGLDESHENAAGDYVGHKPAERVADEFVSRLSTAVSESWRGTEIEYREAAELIARRMGFNVHEFASTTDRGGDTFLMLSPHDAEEAASEWQAWLDGDVYGIAVQVREDAEYGEWEDVGDTAVWGFYGEQWAREAALEALADYAPRHRADVEPSMPRHLDMAAAS